VAGLRPSAAKRAAGMPGAQQSARVLVRARLRGGGLQGLSAVRPACSVRARRAGEASHPGGRRHVRSTPNVLVGRSRATRVRGAAATRVCSAILLRARSPQRPITALRSPRTCVPPTRLVRKIASDAGARRSRHAGLLRDSSASSIASAANHGSAISARVRSAATVPVREGLREPTENARGRTCSWSDPERATSGPDRRSASLLRTAGRG